MNAQEVARNAIHRRDGTSLDMTSTYVHKHKRLVLLAAATKLAKPGCFQSELILSTETRN